MKRWFLFLLVTVTGCGAAEVHRSDNDVASTAATPQVTGGFVTHEASVMGTELSISAFHQDSAKAEAAIADAIKEIRRVEDLATDWRPSPLMTLNRAAGDGPHVVPNELAELIEKALVCSELTEGAFDCTFRAVGELWDFKANPPRVPSHEQITAAMAKVGYQKVHASETVATITRPEGLWIGLGGIAKGYGVDRAMAVLMEHGIEHAIVNAGGDLKALGKNGSELWSIAIRHPRDQRRIIAVIPVSNACVVTSGDYERFFELNGKRYHHILDPRTGYPSTGAISATVVAPNAAAADALATALCVLDPEQGVALIEQLPRVEAIVVSLDGEVWSTTGLSPHSSKD